MNTPSSEVGPSGITRTVDSETQVFDPVPKDDDFPVVQNAPPASNDMSGCSYRLKEAPRGASWFLLAVSVLGLSWIRRKRHAP